MGSPRRDKVTSRGKLVPGAGFEPARSYPYAPQTYVSANSTTPAKDVNIIEYTPEVNPPFLSLHIIRCKDIPLDIHALRCMLKRIDERT